MMNFLATEIVFFVSPEKEFPLELCRCNHGESAMLTSGLASWTGRHPKNVIPMALNTQHGPDANIIHLHISVVFTDCFCWPREANK